MCTCNTRFITLSAKCDYLGKCKSVSTKTSCCKATCAFFTCETW